jgi:hypothetical protein
MGGTKKDDPALGRLQKLAKAAREHDDDAIDAAVDDIRAAGEDDAGEG